ncbi:hypothetical protein E2C01_096565 [Portunus trituberculatus]|uniref:Uncharacterized protein n=1 Tax=Portunus trituberculatus TaxID=210409 RepID=A0A5B7JY94_PORTR|nr:hypothetical protein [Portunus trituberculatus]
MSEDEMGEVSKVKEMNGGRERGGGGRGDTISEAHSSLGQFEACAISLHHPSHHDIYTIPPPEPRVWCEQHPHTTHHTHQPQIL